MYPENHSGDPQSGNVLKNLNRYVAIGSMASCLPQELFRRQTIDLTGQNFDKITVIGLHHYNSHNHAMWLCKCECGVQKLAASNNLRRRLILSCGCQGKERRTAAVRKHGLRGHALYGVWHHIIERCTDPKDKRYSDYGGRGVTICDGWKNDFQEFYDWCMANGWRKGLQVDKDINGNGMLYSPETCSIVTRKENANKTRKSFYITIDGNTKTAAQWSEISGLNGHLIRARVRAGWEHKRAVFTQTAKHS